MADTASPDLPELLQRDDIAVVFRALESGITGRLVRLGPALDEIISRHDLTDPARAALGEALVLATLLGAGLPAGGQLIVQTQSDGPIPVLVADFASPGQLRGYAREQPAGAPAEGVTHGPAALGPGHLAITLQSASDADRYQSIFALDAGARLETAAQHYFSERDGMTTFLRLAMVRNLVRTRHGQAEWLWRGGGLMLQHDAGGAAGDAGNDDWNRVQILAASVEDGELCDPSLTSDRLLVRLFQEEGVEVTHVTPLAHACRCSREKVENVLRTFGPEEFADMRDADGSIMVRCEFCTSTHRFDPAEFGG